MNSVNITGTVTRAPRTGGEGERAYCFLSVRTDEERSTIVDVAAFGGLAAAAGAFAEGAEVAISGRIGVKEDKKLSELAKRKVWLMQVVAESIAAANATEPPPAEESF